MTTLERIFSRGLSRYAHDPYVRELEAFAEHLMADGYSAKAARAHVHHVQQVLHALRPCANVIHERAVIEAAFRRCGRVYPRAYSHSRWAYVAYLRQVGRLTEPAADADECTIARDAFCSRLVVRRGLKPGTANAYRRWIDDYLQRMLPAGAPLSALRPGMLERYVAARHSTLSRTTLPIAVGCIRAFLRDGIERGQIVPQADAIDRPRHFGDDRPPRALPWPTILQLLASIDRTSRCGRRDHAILHLMAYYGLRPGEVAGVTLESLDAAAGTLTVQQSKTASTLVLPLHRETVELLQDYVRRDRPPTALRALFLRTRAPIRPLSKFAVSYLFKSRARRSALPIAQCSAYCLRHSFAMRLFERGVGMKAIGDLMGHRSLVSTAVYIRLQAAQLREIALPVPTSTAPRHA